MHDGYLNSVDRIGRIGDELPLAEPSFPKAPVAPWDDDVLLDSWLASQTPGRFGHILDVLARPDTLNSAAS